MYFILGLSNIITLVLSSLGQNVKSATANYYCAALSDENKDDCEDKNSLQFIPLRNSEGFINENGFVQEFNARDKNDNSDAFEVSKKRSCLLLHSHSVLFMYCTLGLLHNSFLIVKL